MPKHLTTNDEASFLNSDERDQPNGFAGLDEDGKISPELIPETVSGVMSINGHAGNVVLGPGDVGAVDSDLLGVPSGVATLDMVGKLPVGNLPAVAVQSVNGYIGPAVTLAASDLNALPTSGTTLNVQMVMRGNGTVYPVVIYGNGTESTRFSVLQTGAMYSNSLANTMYNVGVGDTTTPFGDGMYVLGMKNAATAPSSNPSGGLVAYSEGGVLVIRQSNGDIVTAGPGNENAPADQGFIAWTADPASSGTGSMTSGAVRLARVILRRPATITNLWSCVTTAGSSLTAGQSFIGLYSSSGTRVAVSTDQASSWASTGVKQATLSSPYNAAAGVYYIAAVSNGTTPPVFYATGSSSVSPVNANQTVSTARYLSGPTGQTSLPASITMASNTLNSTAYWFALS